MRRILLWAATTATVLVLAFGYSTSTMGPNSGGDSVLAAQPASQAEQTVTGPAVGTQWGPVQVQIGVSGGRVAEVQVLQYPNNNPRDQQINNYALPILVDQTLEIQSADVDMVSGATLTSQGYRQSLQAALDEAGL